MMYAEWHCHSAFSFLDGASLPKLAATAHELGYSALALTDHNGLYGSMAFAQAAKPLGLQAITGAEVTLVDGVHLTLLAETPQGYANLCRLLTETHLRARRPPRPAARVRCAATRQEGLIVLSAAGRAACCRGRSPPKALGSAPARRALQGRVRKTDSSSSSAQPRAG